MLTSSLYNQYWQTYFANGKVLPLGTQAPLYSDYADREAQMQDYHSYLGNRQLKYLLIGEAAPSSGKTYFYNPYHLERTSWMFAPYQAFYGTWKQALNKGDKLDRLKDLAEKGFLLIDLFPFALNYEDLRKSLNNTGASVWFYNNHLLPIINNLKSSQRLNSRYYLAFSGPLTIHNHLVASMGSGIISNPADAICYYNSPTVKPGIKKALTGKGPKPPLYRCCAGDRSGNVNEFLVRNAFDLP